MANPTGGAANGSSIPNAVIRRGSGQFAVPENPTSQASPQPVSGNSEGFQLNFTDTDIATVVSSVLGDGLSIPYLVSPQVKGQMTLQATRALTREELLAALEAALHVGGAAMVNIKGVMNIVPLRDAPRQIDGIRLKGQGAPGFGIYIVPLQYIGAGEMEKLLQPFAPEGGILRVDSARNLLLLAGSSQEIATMLGVVNTFDVDWLAGMSFALYPLSYVDAKAMADELGEVFSDAKSPIAGIVRLVPLPRMNSLLVVTPQARYLTQVESWIKQLDISGLVPGRRIYVYDVQNGKADDIAKSLASILSLSMDSFTGSPTSAGSRFGGSSLSSPSTSSLGGGGISGVGGLSGGNFPSGGLSSNPSGGNTSSQSSRPSTAASSGGSPSQTSGADGGQLKIVPSSENNSLLIFATPSEYAMIEPALKRLDEIPIQVLIEASIAEVTLTDDLKFGLNWSYLSKQGPISFSDAANGVIAQSFPGLSFLYNTKANISAVLNTLESLTNVRVLSSPKVLVLNNREADLEVGDQVPIISQTAVSTASEAAPIVNSVQMQDTGVILRVTPRANKSGRITLDIDQEVSNVTATTSSNIDSPTIQERKISSTVSVDSGETLALGGLIQDTRSKNADGVPFLRRIPLLGSLFGSDDHSSQRTELIILITPRVIRSRDESDALMHELRDEFQALKDLAPELKRNSDLSGSKVEQAPDAASEQQKP